MRYTSVFPALLRNRAANCSTAACPFQTAMPGLARQARLPAALDSSRLGARPPARDEPSDRRLRGVPPTRVAPFWGKHSGAGRPGDTLTMNRGCV